MSRLHIVLSLILALPLSVGPGAQPPPTITPPPIPIPVEFFGMHFHHLGSTTPFPSSRIAEWRLWDAYVAWPNLEPARGRWQFQTLDKYVELASEHNIGLLLPLGLSPSWASARPQEKSTYQPGAAAEPRDIGDWRIYVATVARRYKGRIHAYEIWNEPNLKQFYSGSVDQMITLTREASQIIRSVDPKAVIVSPSATQDRGVAWLAEFLLKGGGEFVDVIGYHFYVAPQPPEATLALVSSVRQTMNQTGAGDKPIWNTEAGWFLPKPFPADLAAAYVVREFVINWAAGVQRLYWYAWDNHGWVSLETTERDNRTLTPAGNAYAVASRWLSGARMLSCNTDSQQRWVCELDRDGHHEWLLWSNSGRRPFKIPDSWNVTTREDVSGASEAFTADSLDLSPAPVLVRGSVSPAASSRGPSPLE